VRKVAGLSSCWVVDACRLVVPSRRYEHDRMNVGK
jgi:hypothetical protein